MKPTSPQLNERRREPIEAALEAALDVALSALRRIARHNDAEIAHAALGRIEAILPQTGQQR